MMGEKAAKGERPTRRDFFKAVAGAAAALSTGNAMAEAEAPKPNIVYILADDLGYGDLGCYGNPKIRTPNLDRMAAEGARFTDHYTGSPVCAPARCTLMTGRHSGHAYVRGNGRLPLRAEDVTVAEVLQGAGYRTGMVGKWGLGLRGTTGEPAAQGFDHFFGFLHQGRAHRYYPDWVWRNDRKVEYPENDGLSGTYVHDEFTREALEFIDRNAGRRPFFLYLPYTIPHADMLVPEESKAPYVGEFPEQPYEHPDDYYMPQEHPNAAYAGMVSRMDRDVGRILERLKERGVDRETLVVFTSDNGPCPAGGKDPQVLGSAGPLRGLKRSLYEGGIRVPMIARWPGHTPAGVEIDRPSAFWDVMATFAGAAGAEPPESDGLSMLPELVGRPDQPEHEFLYWEFRAQQAARTGRWKAYRDEPSAAAELYDLRADIGETEDLSADHPEIVERVLACFERAHEPSEHWPLPGE